MTTSRAPQAFAAAVAEFVRCATGSAAARAQRLLALHPGIAHASLQTELVRADADAVKARLRANPGLATQAGGIQDWEPLLYVCHTCLHHEAPERAAGLVSIATELLDRGANPNAEYHWQWHPELPRTALWGALFASSYRPLAELLLQRGANPTDGVSAQIAADSGNIEVPDLLQRYGMDPNGIPGGVPPLRYIAAPPLVWAAEGRSHPRPGGDHLALARLLMTAGSPTTWTPPEKAPDPEGTQEALRELCRAAASKVDAAPT